MLPIYSVLGKLYIIFNETKIIIKFIINPNKPTSETLLSFITRLA